MNSPSKIQSARANGARSHGPVTPEGKQKSSRNATRHGLLSNTIVLEGESKERFEELLASLTAELKPRNTTEAALVETMAAARWRHLRVLSIQKAQFDIEMAREAAVPSSPVRAAIVFKKLSDNSRVLDVLLRYEVAFDRQFCRALNMLMKLRSSERIFDVSENEPPEPDTIEFPNEPNPPDSEQVNIDPPPSVGRTPWSARVPLDPPFARRIVEEPGREGPPLLSPPSATLVSGIGTLETPSH
ncbi:MAG: hypothetical protein JO307_28270 [Bryobacterales bacterium]|nr:hypothetical protein [Bryobacterales bacterium]MBV9400946.1 hypothetical protein [Bryobacterales bacterium]